MFQIPKSSCPQCQDINSATCDALLMVKHMSGRKACMFKSNEVGRYCCCGLKGRWQCHSCLTQTAALLLYLQTNPIFTPSALQKCISCNAAKQHCSSLPLHFSPPSWFNRYSTQLQCYRLSKANTPYYFWFWAHNAQRLIQWLEGSQWCAASHIKTQIKGTISA